MNRHQATVLSPATLPYDLVAGVVVFLVALPLCLGIALASNAPLFSGLLAGIIGGIVVGSLSKSHTSVSGPAAGLTAVVSSQTALLGSFEAFLMAVMLAGLVQIVMGLAQAGFIKDFFPSSVIKGLLAAIGVIVILKQIPHALGHDADPEGEMAFIQPDQQTTFSELVETVFDIQPGATLIGLLSLVILVVWERIKTLKKSLIPAPLVVVLIGVFLKLLLDGVNNGWSISETHLVQVPVAESPLDFVGFLRWPVWSHLLNPAVYTCAVTLAIMASLETLLNLEAVDKLDPQQRVSPPSRELLAQGVGNLVSGLVGGLPMTSVIVRSSVNVHMGAKTKLSAIFHGVLLLVCVVLFPTWLNQIPLSSLAAILIVTGFKLASPQLMMQMWREGSTQFLPFVSTIVAIVLTDLLTGVLIGLAISLGFILHSNLRRPLRLVPERHLHENVLRIQLASQVGFLNRAALIRILNEVPAGGHVFFDARNTDYIDSDLLDLIADFKNKTAPARHIKVSLLGFPDQARLPDELHFAAPSSPDFYAALTPRQVLDILKEGNERFQSGQCIDRIPSRRRGKPTDGHFPLAVVLSCIDSRSPVEWIFDLGAGDLLSTRVAGTVLEDKVLGSLEYGAAVARAKLLLVMGHTHCGAVRAAVELLAEGRSAREVTGCEHLESITTEIQKVVSAEECRGFKDWSPEEQEVFLNGVVRRHVLATVRGLRSRCRALDRLVQEGRLMILGALYDVATGACTFLDEQEVESVLTPPRVAEEAAAVPERVAH